MHGYYKENIFINKYILKFCKWSKIQTKSFLKTFLSAFLGFATNANFRQKNFFINFIINSSVLFPKLIELFFSDEWIGFFSVRKAPTRKFIFSKITFYIGFKVIYYSFIFLIALYGSHRQFFYEFHRVFM